MPKRPWRLRAGRVHGLCTATPNTSIGERNYPLKSTT
jgi:hypothetical protein